MGLDIYVGSFTRYHCGDWETVVARVAREQGIPFKVIRPGSDRDEVIDPKVVHQAVVEWRGLLEDGLRPHLPDGIPWDERPEAAYFTDKPDWAGYSGVVLLAAHAVCPEFPLPASATVELDKDPAFQSVAAQEYRCRYSHIFDVEIWLPCDFPFTFHATDVVGNQHRFGSSVTLLEQLRSLNDETYKADAETLAQWKSEGAGSNDTFNRAAHFGLAMFMHLAQLSVEHWLPMRLDY